LKAYTRLFSAFGTLNRIVVYLNENVAEPPSVLNSIERRFSEMDDKLSVFKTDSEVSRINAAAGEEYVEVSADTLEIITLAKQYSMMTNGFFDLTANPFTQLWRQRKVPSGSDITEYRKLVDYHGVILRGRKAKLAKKGMSIDLGGIVKGYAAEVAQNMLAQAGIHDALINLGGTIVSVGKKREIAVKNPFDNLSVAAVIRDSADEIIVTSGVYEKHFVQNGKLFHHIINPRTGYSSESGLISVTLIGNNGAELDILATACIVQGIEESRKILESKGIGALFFLSDGQILANAGICERVKEKS
jgi:thiamine biosynthesis lipoprotein